MKLEEKNVIVKSIRGKIRIALLYPNLYKAGMANLGFRILYDIFNKYDRIFCERFFSDYTRSIETKSYLRSFDVIAISWQYENDAINILKILRKCGIELDRRKRRQMIIVGGPCTLNPMPLRYISDAFFIGEVEERIHDFINLLIEYGCNKSDILEELKNVEGFLVSEYLNQTKRVIVRDLNSYFPIKQLIPKESAFGSSFLIDISRGCAFNCKFCLGASLKPKRDRSIDHVKYVLEKNLEINNINKITILSPSFIDYYKIEDLCTYLIDKKFNVSIPSLRADRMKEIVLNLLKASGQRTLTIAPESSERIRVKLNKKFGDETIYDVCELSKKYGINKIKLYFMIGLPDEEEKDIKNIINIIKNIKNNYNLRVSCTFSIFVPKMFTELENETIIQKDRFLKIKKILKEANKYAEISIENYNEAFIQYLINHGDENTIYILDKLSKGYPLKSSDLKLFNKIDRSSIPIKL